MSAPCGIDCPGDCGYDPYDPNDPCAVEPAVTCTADACTEAGKTMITRAHSPERCPAKPPTPCATCGVVSEPNVRAVRLLTGD